MQIKKIKKFQKKILYNLKIICIFASDLVEKI